MDFLRLLAEMRTPFLDLFFQFCTYLGQDIAIVVIICVLYWCINKKLGYLIALTFFASGLALQCLKVTFHIPRPWVLDPNFKAVPSALPAATGYSFPSGHTQSATALYFTLALNTKKKRWQILLPLLFLLVGFSRMYLGCHTPKDVVTAILLAVVMGLFVHILMEHLKDCPKVNLVIALILATASVLAFIYASFLTNSGKIDLDNAMDCCKAAGAGLAFGLGWYLERTFIKFSTDGTTKEKVLRFLVGIAVTALIEFVGKALLPEALLPSAFRYFLLVLWVVCIYPAIIKKAASRTKNNKCSS